MKEIEQGLGHIFGIRHHGPGSARSLQRALTALAPDIILVEGPPEANEIIALAADAQMQPPVALLVYAPEKLKQAVYYPFSVFSPEWQAIQYGLAHDIPVRFMDLPQAHQLAQVEMAAGVPDRLSTEMSAEVSLEEERLLAIPQMLTLRQDPLQYLATAAGYSDSERWWEHMVEQRQDSTDLFSAILEAMLALRTEADRLMPLSPAHPPDLRELQREAHMRKTMRQASQEGFERIAVVCGAWHSPALSGSLPAAKADNTLLKGLPKIKVKATWVPWSYGRLALRSGYGAGIQAPGWYHHLWHHPQAVATHWLIAVAQQLRAKDMDAAAASIIEAVRLAETLAALRQRAVPDLEDLNEATQAVLCFGQTAPMQLIHEQLIIGERLGQVPETTPTVPLQQDLQALQKRLRLKPEASPRTLELDLRQETDLARSQLLHRLQLLGIPWGIPQTTRGKGTFKEGWQLVWQPEFAIALIEASRWGNTVEAAATAYAIHEAATASALPTLTHLLEQVLLSALVTAIDPLMTAIQSLAAIANDMVHLMTALPPLVNILRYSDVRQTQTEAIQPVVDGLIPRICIGLPGACTALNEATAAVMEQHLSATHQVIQILQQPAHQQTWFETLQKLANSLLGLLAGRCCRLLLDVGEFSPDTAADRLHFALSTASEPLEAAAWIEGFLKGSGLLLLHDDTIWQVLDRWLMGLGEETFIQLLPLLRRTFSTFAAPERRQMREKLHHVAQPKAVMVAPDESFNHERAAAILPLAMQLLV